MKELKVGERVTITLEAVEQQKGCDGCFFSDADGTCNDPYKNKEGGSKFNCINSERSDHKNVIFKEVKE